MKTFNEWLIENNNEEFVRLTLSPEEVDAAEWALDPMTDSKEELFGDDAILPELKGNVLVLHKNKDVLEDLIYRLTIQVRDMFETIPKDHEDYDASFIKASKSLANKLKKILL